MINDQERLIDGFHGLPAGMDGSKAPALTPEDAAWFATNVTFRCGNGPRTRPGFREVPPTFWINPQSGGEEDVDQAFASDYVDGFTSSDRYNAFILNGALFQGSLVYQVAPERILVVVDGRVLTLDLSSGRCIHLNPSDPLDATLPVYLTQAETFIVIQNGAEEPRVYDGSVVRRASFYGPSAVPVGKQSVYGQGRLFTVVNDREISAGDIVFGGSVTSVGILGSSFGSPTTITTAADHNFQTGDQVTIEGHSSTPPINSTYTVTRLSANTFSIPVAVSTAGLGGSVKKPFAGESSDCLRSTEVSYLAEGGLFSVPSRFGDITSLTFSPTQDTATGQGELIAFCERGAVSFQVALPRESWKQTEGFQRILFDGIGAVSDSVALVNGDLFFRSIQGNGLRSYRNAKAEFDSYGQTPLSGEVDPILRQDTASLLSRASLAHFDNRLFLTCLPRMYPPQAATAEEAEEMAELPANIVYEGLAVLDFQSVSTGRGKSAAVFDGLWNGLRILALVSGTLAMVPSLFAWCQHDGKIELWQITENDEFDTPADGRRPISAGVVTRAMDFKKPWELKKLLRCDLWFGDLGGGDDFPFRCVLSYRPDEYPNFTEWQRVERCFHTEFLLSDEKNLLTDGDNIGYGAWVPLNVFSQPSDQSVGFLGAAGTMSRWVPDTTDGYHRITQDVSADLTTGTYVFSVYARADDFRWPGSGTPAHLVLGIVDAFGVPQVAYFDVASRLVVQTSGPSMSVPSVFGRIEPTGDAGVCRCSLVINIQAGISPYDGRVHITIPRAAGLTSFAGNDSDSWIDVWGAQLESISDPNGYATEFEAAPPRLLNLERGYAPQIKFPTPPRAANLVTDVPAYLGHDFTLRVNWEGRARLSRLMLHGSNTVEAVNGGSL